MVAVAMFNTTEAALSTGPRWALVCRKASLSTVESGDDARGGDEARTQTAEEG